MTEKPQPPPKPRKRFRLPHGLAALALGLVLLLLGGIGFLAVTGRAVHLPAWAVARAEAQIAGSLGPASPYKLSIDGLSLTIARDLVPRLRLDGLKVALKDGGAQVLSLPEAHVTLSTAGLMAGTIAPKRVILTGARLALARDKEGRFDLQFGAGPSAELASFAALLDAGDRLLAAPAFAHLEEITAEGISLTLADAQVGRTWQVGDGRLALENRPAEVALSLSMTLVAGGQAPAQAALTIVSDKASAAARVNARLDQLAAADLAMQAPPLAFLQILDAPLAGEIGATLGADGRVASLDAQLSLASGALRPPGGAAPVPFDKAGFFLRYDGAGERLTLSELTAEGPALRLRAHGQMQIPGIGQGAPEAFISQIAIDEMRIDPEGLFEKPVRFSGGAIDARMRLNPFTLDIGQITLMEGTRRLHGQGRVIGAPDGWDLAFDLGLNEIRATELAALWPVKIVPRTRAWLIDNVEESALSDVKAALRQRPGQNPRFNLSYEFSGTNARFIRSLPPLQAGKGYATVEGNTFTMVMDEGHIEAPQGGKVDLSGTVFSVLDITQRPPQAELRLKSAGPLVAHLSLLDEKPFQFLTKAGRPVDLGQGQMQSQGLLRWQMQRKVDPKSIRYEITAQVYDFASDKVLAGHSVTAPRLDVTASPRGLRIEGQGALDGVPLTAALTQGFTPEEKGKSTVTGQITLNSDLQKAFKITLPPGFNQGAAQGDFTLALKKGAPGQLTLTSDLKGLMLALPELTWQKAAGEKGDLQISATLSKPPVIESLRLSAAGLTAKGRITLNMDGTLNEARFTPLTRGDWLKADVTLKGQGKGQLPALSVTGGQLDLRRMEFGSRKSEGDTAAARALPPMKVALDEVVLSGSQRLTSLSGTFAMDGGFHGDFTAALNGKAALTGAVGPVTGGLGARVQSDNAGAVLAAAGIFADARGGTLDLQLFPNGTRGHFWGRATAKDLRVTRAPVLAALLNAISVIGLLEQLNGNGLLFSSAEAEFRLSPNAVEVSRASAVGASMGVSMAGLYDSATRRLDMQGVISPIYLINGIGALFSRQREGLFGFNYTLTGTADTPKVRVNPLSLLTPGMFRDLFRTAPPRLPQAPSGGG